MISKARLSLGILLLGAVLISACRVETSMLGMGGGNPDAGQEVSESVPPISTPTPLPPPKITQVTITPSPTLSPTLAPAASQTPDPYQPLTIDYLTNRAYGGDQITVQETMARYDSFTRYLVSYPSDDQTIFGFLNIPHGDGPFLPVIAIHGYIDPEVYETLDYTTRYADALARSGFAVVHPNLRGYPPSTSGPNSFRVGMAIDILNLIAILKGRAGVPGDPLEKVDSSKIGLWGHSMGGGISLRVLTVSPEVDAAVLYGSMSGNEAWNFTKILEWSEGARGLEELSVPEDVLTRISPIFYLDRIQASVSVHHGEADALVPPAWSEDLCQQLHRLEKAVDCYTYPGQPHTFRGEGDRLFIERTVEFFQEQLKPIP